MLFSAKIGHPRIEKIRIMRVTPFPHFARHLEFRLRHVTACLIFTASLLDMPAAAARGDASAMRVARFVDPAHVELAQGTSHAIVGQGQRFGAWTLMAISAAPQPYAIVEDFVHKDGALRFVDPDGVRLELAKTLESNEPDAHVFLGHSAEEILASPADLLAAQILAKPGDPEYAEIASAFPPIGDFKSGAHGFVGTPDSLDKIGIFYGGRTPTFDPAVYDPAIDAVRKQGKVWDGLVGGYLPVHRFVYPQDTHVWTEMLAFAPLRLVNGNDRAQPVWYRVTRVVDGTPQWSRVIDSYHPFPPDRGSPPEPFYADLLALKHGWDTILAPGMHIDLPDPRVANMARFGLVRAIMTRVGDWPKYGAYDRDYAGTEHDGFPDTFTVETAAMLDWGLIERAGRYIENYFGKFVRDNGALLYRGPETGQFGRMLTVLAQYANYGGDPQRLLTWRSRIDAITNLLLSLRANALKLPRDDPAYGMLAGWSEADSSLDRDPSRYVAPYFSNSTEAARGFRDLGKVWQRLGAQSGDGKLAAWGTHLVDEATALRKDIDTAIARSLLQVDGQTVLPAIAGVKEPFHIAVGHDAADPQYRSYRAYMEMLYSGSLTAEQVGLITAYRASHYDTLLGLPSAYGYHTGVAAGFLTYGHGYGLIQSDRVREALLVLYSDMAHQYTRGSWMAPETRKPLEANEAAPYCTPAQLVASMLTRWLLVFEDPEAEMLWLAKATPRAWLEEGKKIVVEAAPTRWGRVGYTIASQLKSRTIRAMLDLPATGIAAEIHLRLRAPGDRRVQSATLDGRALRIDADGETVVVPAGASKRVEIVARF
jgi:hypothetical protein